MIAHPYMNIILKNCSMSSQTNEDWFPTDVCPVTLSVLAVTIPFSHMVLVPHAALCSVFPINQSVFADFWALLQMEKVPDTFFKLQLSCLCTGHVSMKKVVNSLRAHQLFGVWQFWLFFLVPTPQYKSFVALYSQIQIKFWIWLIHSIASNLDILYVIKL